MAPVKLKGLLPETRRQFAAVVVRHNRKWVTKFQCVYPSCKKGKPSGTGVRQMEPTRTQVYVHAKRFHRNKAAPVIREDIFCEPKPKASERLEEPGNDLDPNTLANTKVSFKVLDDWEKLM